MKDRQQRSEAINESRNLTPINTGGGEYYFD